MGLEKLNFQELLSCLGVRRKPKHVESLNLKGKWLSEIWRNGKKISEHVAYNDITTTGKNTLFDTMFNAATQSTSSSWCAGLINASGFTGYTVATDTMSSHSGWTEWTGYSQTTRVTWGQGSTSGASITNASAMVFDINASVTVQGLFITNVNTKGSTSGLLWSAASYTSPPVCNSGDEIRSIYSLSA